MSNPELDQAKEPLKRFLMMNRNLNMDEKVEAYGMLLDCIIDVIKATNKQSIESMKAMIRK